MNNVLAAFIMLTRLPFWKIKEVPAECFKHVVPYWPLVGLSLIHISEPTRPY